MNFHEPRLKVGDILDERYRLLDLLGGGGMGFVYLAEDLRVHGRKRAIKELKYTSDRAIFVEEAKMLSALNHPNLPQIVDTIPPEDHGCGYIVMDYIPGETLSTVFIRAGKRLSYQKIIDIVRQICDIFVYLHERLDIPVVYRDLKPSNLLVDELGQIRLIDFGIARFLEESRKQDTVRLGTPGFAAPEQYEGKSGPASDLYNLGALLFYLLSGGTYPDGQQKKLTSAPPQLAAMTAKLLHHDPTKRYQSASEVLDELDQLEKQMVNLSVDHQAQRDHLRKPVIAVGSLYQGAGASFIAQSLARFCEMENITVTCSHNEGNLAFQEAKTADDVLIVDIGSQWHQPQDEKTLDTWADLIILVADPMPQGWRSMVCERKLRIAETWHDQGINVHFVANRAVDVKGKKQWLRSFPWKPTCIVPALDYTWMVEAAWGGVNVQQHSKAGPLLQKSMASLLELIWNMRHNSH